MLILLLTNIFSCLVLNETLRQLIFLVKQWTHRLATPAKVRAAEGQRATHFERNKVGIHSNSNFSAVAMNIPLDPRLLQETNHTPQKTLEMAASRTIKIVFTIIEQQQVTTMHSVHLLRSILEACSDQPIMRASLRLTTHKNMH